ncbi:MAG: SO_0444 family Cu/Zn efflux transporter [Sedimentisphaerales bacterium]|nr:SO_0444 family Cu/Zn efflux transporter [Sedimentisphaerales bacterium]
MTEFILTIIKDFWATVGEMSPYLLFGFFVAGLLSVLVSQRLVERHLGGRGLWPLLKASVLGVPLPLCSCGVIPVSMSLRKHGASKGSTIAFLLSTPQTGVDSIFVTLSLLGPVFAIFRPVVALITGLVGGTLVDMFGQGAQTESHQEKCTDACCSDVKTSKVRKAFTYGFVTLPRDIGKAMLVGLLVAALISALVPDGYFAEKLGTGIFPLIAMMILGIPVYVCATASVPVAAALILKGLSPGAALVFLMTGPATNAASFVTIWKVLGKTTAILYLVTVAGCALMSGMLLDTMAAGVEFEVAVRPGWMLPDIVKSASALILFVILGFALLRGPKKTHINHESTLTQQSNPSPSQT